MKKIIPIIAVAIILPIAIFALVQSNEILHIQKNTNTVNSTNDTLVEIPWNTSLFKIMAYKKDVTIVNGYQISTTQQFQFKPENMDMYKGLAVDKQNTIVVIPTFTQTAYGKNGFYDYYNKKCDSKCLTVKIDHSVPSMFQSSQNGVKILTLLNYSFITDIDIDKDPGILSQYDKVILLHNEYVTKREFDAITHHTHVLYLYPNSLFGEIKSDYSNDTITLVKGHGFPNNATQNGFGWKFDNTMYEPNVFCTNWGFYQIDNGYMLNCYPEHAIYQNQMLLKTIKVIQ